MSDHSNVEDVNSTLRKVADCLDMTRGAGKELLALIAVRISDRAQGEQGPRGDWAANRGKYGAKKRKSGLPVGVGLKQGGTARMLSLQQIKGEPTITPTEASMRFGTDEKTARKGQWFTAGSEGTDDAEPSGAKNQPARPFYEITDQDADELLIIAGEAAAQFLGDL